MGAITLERKVVRWLGQLDDHDVRGWLGAATFERAQKYAHQRRVFDVQPNDDPNDDQGYPGFTARVEGSRAQPYEVWIHLNMRGSSVLNWTGICTCPVSLNCKHCGAAVLAMRDLVQARPAARVASVPVDARPIPAWDQALVTALASTGASTGRNSVEPKVQLALLITAESLPGAGAKSASTPRLQARPLKRGAKDRWVKTGVSWSEITHDYHHVYDPAQREALAQVYTTAQAREQASGYAAYYGYSTSTQVGLADLGPQVWQLLQEVREAGGAGGRLRRPA